ncbi:MAG TPA: hypothetical protein VFG83_05305 [Kofleriaceae bacterium]|nr:hypothetical protein [Kofleriaceae bacterium]
MKLQKTSQLFFGCKIDSRLRDALSRAKPGDRRYFEDPESPFLRVLPFGDERWIGKVIDPGVNVTEVEDIQRNVTSILRRIAPDVRQAPSSIKIFSIGAEEAPPETEAAQPAPATRGPYIANY